MTYSTRKPGNPMGIIHISFGGPDREIVDETGKHWKFEMHRIFGPSVIDRHGDIKSTQPGPRASFWRVVTFWSQQGQKIGADGLCVWEKPPEPKYVHLGGRHYALEGSSLAKRFGVKP